MGAKRKSSDRRRPAKYDPSLAAQICSQIASRTCSLRTIAKELGASPTTIYDWLNAVPEFAELYARAKSDQADLMAEEMLEIADDSSGDVQFDEDGNPRLNSEFVQRSRLRVDTRKWLASKLKPKKYGDAQTVKHEGEIDVKHSLASRLMAADERTNQAKS